MLRRRIKAAWDRFRDRKQTNFDKPISADYEGFIQIKNTLSSNDISMYLRKESYMEREFLRDGLYGNWEKESLKIWAELSKKSNYILDVGANTGVYSLIAKSQNPSANVYAIEPVDINFEVLIKNIEKNEFNIVAEKLAMSDKEGKAKMFMLKGQLNYMTSVNDNRYDKHPEIKGESEVVEIEVPIKTYKYLEEKYKIPKVDLIKIDVEGHEVEVLRGMHDLINRDKPNILLEVIGDANALILDEMFKKLDYNFISIDEINKATVVNKLWDNDHHNFLICNKAAVQFLQEKDLVEW